MDGTEAQARSWIKVEGEGWGAEGTALGELVFARC